MEKCSNHSKSAEIPSHICLASIEKIQNLSSILGADQIEKAEVLGYVTIVRKGQFLQDQLVVWHQPDTILPDKPIYSFLKKDNFRLKARKIRGVVSQGLVLPLEDALGEEVMKDSSLLLSVSKEGYDVTDLVQIKKYHKPESDSSSFQSHPTCDWPIFLPKTDEMNIRSKPKIIQELAGKEVVITQKIDGSSATFFYRIKEDKFGVCSRNFEIQEPTDPNNVWWIIARKYQLPKRLKELCTKKQLDLSLQGELFGPKIQGNKVGISEPSLAVFNLFNITHGVYASHDSLVEVASVLQVPTVPLIWRGIFTMSLPDLIEMSNKQEYQNKGPAEGIVVRPVEETYSQCLEGRLSGKVISERYALKYGE